MLFTPTDPHMDEENDNPKHWTEHVYDLVLLLIVIGCYLLTFNLQARP